MAKSGIFTLSVPASSGPKSQRKCTVANRNSRDSTREATPLAHSHGRPKATGRLQSYTTGIWKCSAAVSVAPLLSLVITLDRFAARNAAANPGCVVHVSAGEGTRTRTQAFAHEDSTDVTYPRCGKSARPRMSSVHRPRCPATPSLHEADPRACGNSGGEHQRCCRQRDYRAQYTATGITSAYLCSCRACQLDLPASTRLGRSAPPSAIARQTKKRISLEEALAPSPFEPFCHKFQAPALSMRGIFVVCCCCALAQAGWFGRGAPKEDVSKGFEHLGDQRGLGVEAFSVSLAVFRFCLTPFALFPFRSVTTKPTP